MSSATYLIASESFNKANNQVCFYIDHNGHPALAAKYFLAMHQVKNQWGGYAERFLRANAMAAFTDNHEAHYYTEYRYTLENDGNLMVHQASFHRMKKWGLLFQGKWYDFVNEFLALPFEDCLFNFTMLKVFDSYLYQVMTLKEAVKLSEENPDNPELKIEIQNCLRMHNKGTNSAQVELLI